MENLEKLSTLLKHKGSNGSNDHFVKAYQYVYFGNPDKARQEYRKVIEILKGKIDPQLLLQRIAAHDYLNNFKDVVKDASTYLTYLKNNPDKANSEVKPYLLYMRLKAYHFLDMFKKAFRDCVDFLKISKKMDNEQKAVVLSIQGLALSRFGEFEKAIKCFDECLIFHKSLTSNIISPQQIYHNRGLAYALIGKFEKGIRDVKTAHELDPGDPLYLHTLGNMYSQMGNKKESLKTYNESLRTFPKSELTKNLSRLNRGRLLAISGRHRAAIVDFNAVIELDPNNYEAYHNRGAAYNELKEYRLAIESFNKVLTLQPSQNQLWKTYFARGMNYMEMGASFYDKALKDFKRFESMQPFNPKMLNGYFFKGSLLCKKGKHEDAKKDLKKCYLMEKDFMVNGKWFIFPVGVDVNEFARRQLFKFYCKDCAFFLVKRWKSNAESGKHTKAERVCAFCEKKAKIMKRCGRCRRVYYCGMGCQKKDWSKHKLGCEHFDLVPVEKSDLKKKTLGRF